MMTALRKDAMALLERMPEDKLYFMIQIMRGIDGLYEAEQLTAKEHAFEELEHLRKSVPELDYDRELKKYREEKYGNADIS